MQIHSHELTTPPQNAIHNHAVRQVASIRKDLGVFASDVSSAPLSLQGSIAAGITQLSKTVDEYESFARQETEPEKQEKTQLKLNKFRSDLAELRQKLAELKREREELNTEVNRSALLNRRPQASENPYDQPSAAMAQGLHKERETLNRGNAQLDEILAMGRETFEELVHSNRAIEMIGQKLTGTLSTLGVSQDTIRVIQRRAKEDRLVFGVCVVVFFVCCYYVYKWFG